MKKPNLSEKTRQKLRKSTKNGIRSLFEKNLQQRIEQLIEHTEEVVRAFKS